MWISSQAYTSLPWEWIKWSSYKILPCNETPSDATPSCSLILQMITQSPPVNKTVFQQPSMACRILHWQRCTDSLKSYKESYQWKNTGHVEGVYRRCVSVCITFSKPMNLSRTIRAWAQLTVKSFQRKFFTVFQTVKSFQILHKGIRQKLCHIPSQQSILI